MVLREHLENWHYPPSDSEVSEPGRLSPLSWCFQKETETLEERLGLEVGVLDQGNPQHYSPTSPDPLDEDTSNEDYAPPEHTQNWDQAYEHLYGAFSTTIDLTGDSEE